MGIIKDILKGLSKNYKVLEIKNSVATIMDNTDIDYPRYYKLIIEEL